MEPAAPRRPFQFSLKMLFLVVALAGLAAAVVGRSLRFRAELEDEQRIANELSDVSKSCPANLSLQLVAEARTGADGNVDFHREWQIAPSQQFGDPESLLKRLATQLRQRALDLGCLVESEPAINRRLQSANSGAYLLEAELHYRYRSATGIILVSLLSGPHLGSVGPVSPSESLFQIVPP